METFKVAEWTISNKIERDLQEVQELAVISKDPMGYAIYLYFLLKNKRRSVEVDNLIDWMNSWVENILIQRNFGKFIDIELASSLFAHFSLRSFRRLRVDVKTENLKQLVSEYIEDGHFFNNFTLSSIIALALADFKDDIEEYSNLLAWIEKQVDERNIFNDAKNMVFASILFKKVGFKEHIKRVFDYCYERLLKNNIPYHDELYYAYVLWKFRSLREKKEDLQKIREFTSESLENAKRVILKVDRSLEEIYGVNTQKVASKISASKIYLGVFIDLLNDFSQGTITVSKEELARKDISLWISLGSLFSALIFSLGVAITWLAFQLNTLIDFSMLIAHPFWMGAAKFAINGLIFVFVVFLFTTSVSLFWDVVFKRIGHSQLIKDNLASRLKKHVLWKIIVPLLLGFLKMFFGI
jgi:hypothetical protein